MKNIISRLVAITLCALIILNGTYEPINATSHKVNKDELINDIIENHENKN